QAKQRLAGDLGDRIPDRHVDGADGNRALAVAARLLVHHQGGPALVRRQVLTVLVEQGLGLGLEQASAEALADETALSIAAVGIEPVADDWPSVSLHVGHDRDQARRHLGEVDIGVADRGGDRFADLGNVDDADSHGAPLSSRWAPGIRARSGWLEVDALRELARPRDLAANERLAGIDALSHRLD